MAEHKVVLTGVDTGKLVALSSEKTRELLTKYHEGHSEVKETLIMGNLKLVLSLVNKFARRVDNLDDLFQIGVIGLIKAIENFDLSQNVKFSTYAVPMILGEIKRYLRDNSFMRVSRQIKDRAYQAMKVKEEYIAKHQKEPSNEEIAAILHLTPYEIYESLEAINAVSSLYEPLYNDFDESLELSDTIAEDPEVNEKMINHLSLNEGLKHLNDIEKQIIKKRYYEGMTQFEIANEFAISQAQVSRLEKNALKTLKNYF